MSNDLISRKALLGTERLLMTDIVQNNPTAKYILEQVLYDIEHADTAFDKEKVMEKLKHCRDYYDINEQPKKPFDYWECADIRERKGKWMAYDDAIEIVEKGGIE